MRINTIKVCIVPIYFILLNSKQLKTIKAMKEMNKIEQAEQPTIVRYVESARAGIQLLTLSRCSIGYVVRGKKHIYYGDTHYEISRGDIFYLGVGNHYVEDFPEDNRPFEQIVVYYSPMLLQRILLHLNMNFSLNITNAHHCDNCRRMNHVAMPANSILRSFFTHITSYLQDDNFVHDETAENIKITELVYLIVSQRDSCLKSQVLRNVDEAHDNFEQVVYSHIFRDISIEELASKTNRSLTSFKKEFKRHFVLPPHQWYIRQRLMQSRLLLISTTKSISEIGNECTFPNTSHFIKLFKKEYGMTPAFYRASHCSQAAVGAVEVALNADQVVDEPEMVGNIA